MRLRWQKSPGEKSVLSESTEFAFAQLESKRSVERVVLNDQCSSFVGAACSQKIDLKRLAEDSYRCEYKQ